MVGHGAWLAVLLYLWSYVDETFNTLGGFEKVVHTWRQWVDVSCIQESGPGADNRELKSLERFYNAMLPCPILVLSGKDEFKIFQRYVFLL